MASDRDVNDPVTMESRWDFFYDVFYFVSRAVTNLLGVVRRWTSRYSPPSPCCGALANPFCPLSPLRALKGNMDSCGLHASHYLHIPLYSISLMIIFVEVLGAVTRSLGPFMHKRAWICSQCHGAALVLGRCLVTAAANQPGADCLATCRFSKK